MFYGGRLLSHLSADSPEHAGEAISLLGLNSHAIIMMDSDKNDASSSINKTKERVSGEIERMGGVAWITLGKEIENYIPLEAFKKYLINGDLRSLGQFEGIEAYLSETSPEGYKEFKKSKVNFAAAIIPHITKAEISNTYDLSDRLDHVCTKIKNWNHSNAE